MVHIGKGEIFLFSNGKHLVTVVLCEEFTLIVQQFQGIPLARIVTCGDDDAACSLLHPDGQLGCRRGCESDVDHIIAHAHQSAAHNVLYHLPGYAGIASHDNRIAVRLLTATNESRVSRCEFYDVKRVQCVAGPSADGAADAGNRFY